MRTPQIIMGAGLVVLVVLLLTPQRHPLRYNATSEATVHGVVEEVNDFFCPISGHNGTHLTIATEQGKIQVHLAPSSFVNGQDWKFSRGDEVEVVGARMHYLGREAMIARSVVRRGQTMAVRTSDGKPLWAE